MPEKPMLGGCCVCLDERGWTENPLVYCDGQACSVAVHQACYGIVKVPSGPWFCRKCESQERAAKVKCELCPHRDGALKRTDCTGWAHVVCALYIPEVTFGSVSTMEPIVLQKVPADRFNKTCYICEEEDRSSKAGLGACMACAKQGCKAAFHVTCAQMAGLLCEEASGGNHTKYCGYCKVHLTKYKKTSSAFKNLSSTKLYKLPIQSDDKLASLERDHSSLPEPDLIKPGDIRYTKAGKKRTKSLEESLGLGSTAGDDMKNPPLETQKMGAITSDVTEKTDSPQTEKQTSSASPAYESKKIENDISESSKGQGSQPPSNAVTESKNCDPVQPSGAVASNSAVAAELSNSSQNIAPQSGCAASESTGLTLSSLAEAASIISLSSTEPGEELPSSAQETAPKKHKTTTKDTSLKKKRKENKNSKTKKPETEKKRKKTPLSGIMPHLPVPPPITSKVPVNVAGTAIYPRHSVVSLAEMGLDRTETYDAHEIGDNNKVFKPDFSVDGVKAFEQLQEEQSKDSSGFFLQYGTTPDVSALMEALRKVREDNGHIELTIQQMARRRDQLLLMKTRLQGLQMNNASVTTSAVMPHSNVGQQMRSQVLSPQSVPTSRISSSPHLSSPNQQQQS